MIKNYDEFIKMVNNQANANLIKDICIELMEKNDIKYQILKPIDFYHYKFITDSASIAYGTIIIKEDPNWNMVLHELCHVLVVEPEYRQFVDIDTVKSYCRINKKYPENKPFRTESCTFGLQDMIMSKYNLDASFSGSFFNGKVGGKNSDVPREWTDRAKSIFDQLKIDDLKATFNELSIYDCNDMPEDNTNTIVLTNNGTIFKCNYKSGHFKVKVNKVSISRKKIINWALL